MFKVGDKVYNSQRLHLGEAKIIEKVEDHSSKLLYPNGNFMWISDGDLIIVKEDIPEASNGLVSVSEGGSLRYNKGKPEFSHLSPDFLVDMMGLMTQSAEKYSYLNWTCSQDLRTASDSLMRHLLKFLQGEDTDDESLYSHLTHIAVNAMIMWQNQKDFGDEVDNRFHKSKEEINNVKKTKRT